MKTNVPRGKGWTLSMQPDEIYPSEAGLEPALALLARLGVTHADLRVVNGRDSFVRLGDEQIDALGRLLQKYGLSVGVLETPVFKCPLRKNHAIRWGYAPGYSPDMNVADHRSCLARALAIADRLGAESLRCFAFWREYELDEVFDEVVEKLAAAAGQAAVVERKLLLQNQPDTLAGTGVELARIVRGVGSPHLLAAYDPANSARRGGVPYPDDYAALRGLLGAVQVRFQALDVRSGCVTPQKNDFSGPKLGSSPALFWRQPDLPVSGWVAFGGRRIALEGVRTFLRVEETVGIDYRSFFSELKKDGYAGPISVDTSYFVNDSGPVSHAKIEADVEKTFSSLKQLIAEVGP